MRWGLFQMAEYINMLVLSALTVTSSCGGWLGPGDTDWLGPVWFLLKLALVVYVFIWLRTTLPRLRYDQLMSFGWKLCSPSRRSTPSSPRSWWWRCEGLTFLGRRWRCAAGGAVREHGPGEQRAVSGVSLSRSPAPPGGGERRPGT